MEICSTIHTETIGIDLYLLQNKDSPYLGIYLSKASYSLLQQGSGIVAHTGKFLQATFFLSLISC